MTLAKYSVRLIFGSSFSYRFIQFSKNVCALYQFNYSAKLQTCHVVSSVFRKESNPHEARFDNGKLYYEGETYSKGDQIVIDNKSDSPVR